MILVAPTAFKGTITAPAAAEALAAGVRAALPDEPVEVVPLADGGNGLIDALAAARGGTLRTVDVTAPLGDIAAARILLLSGPEAAAVLESADACGLHLVPAGRRDPLRATTRGVGELLLAAAELAPAAIRLGLGGSATVDGGTGMARVLGWRFLDAAGAPLDEGGGALERLHRIEAPAARPALPPVTLLADVATPLTGPEGAARVFGPQKGADAAAVARLERGLERLAERIAVDLGIDVASMPFGGAAGGLGAACRVFLGAEPVGGAAWVLDAVGFDERLGRARAAVTGEGAYDAQSSLGKAAGVVVARARARDVPVIVVAGRIDGALPAGVTGLSGDGRTLDAAALRALAERGIRALALPRA